MTDAELAAFEARIIAVCAEHTNIHWKNDDYRQCLTIESNETKYFIKFDNAMALWPEFSTQSYIYHYVIRHKNGPRISQALHYFEIPGRAFFVMEHIGLADPPPITNLAERAARAIDWLSKVPAPPEDVMGPSKDAIGPVGGGLIRHRFFNNYEAPVPFWSVADP